MVERKWWPDMDVVWVLVGVTNCVPRPRGIAWVHCFPCPCRLRTVRCMDPGQVTDLLSRAHTCLGSGKTCYSLIMGSGSFWTDWLDAGIGGGLSTTLRPGLKCGGLESKFGWGSRTLDRSETGWSRLCLGCKRGMCFSGYPAGHIDSWIALSTWRYGLTTLWHRSKNCHTKDGKIALIAQPLLEYRTGAYIECWITNKTWLLII
jgi:hypothetical protein